MCKECASEKNREYGRLNRADLNEKRKTKHRANPEKNRAVQNAWRKNNLQRALELERRARSRVLAKDPDRYKRLSTQWQKDNPDKVRARRALRRAQKNKAGGKFTASDLKSLFERQSGKCAYCFVKLGKKYHADHIVPVAKGGTSWPDNIQLCCATCNISKGAKDPLDFARYIGRLI